MGANASSPPRGNCDDILINPLSMTDSARENVLADGLQHKSASAASFLSWAQSLGHPCILKHFSRIEMLGLSWETFELIPQHEIVKDLMGDDRGNVVPSLHDNNDNKYAAMSLFDAKCIVALGANEWKRRTRLPLGIFWDLTFSQSSSLRSAEQIKDAVSAHGKLTTFYGYSKNGTEIRASGYNTLDCRLKKEQIDTIIAIDAMQFASAYPGGATICVISERVDEGFPSHLFDALERQGHRTMLISSISSFLEGSYVEIKKPMEQNDTSDGRTITNGDADAIHRFSDDIVRRVVQEVKASLPAEYQSNKSDRKNNGNKRTQQSNAKTVPSEDEMLRRAIKSSPLDIGPGSAFKSHVIGELRSRYSDLFRTSDDARDFVARAVERGKLSKLGFSQHEMLTIPPHLPTLKIFGQLPRPLSELPAKMFIRNPPRNYALVIDREQCPPDKDVTAKGQLVITDTHRVVLCASVQNCLELQSKKKWLKNASIFYISGKITEQPPKQSPPSAAAFNPPSSLKSAHDHAAPAYDTVCCRICEDALSKEDMDDHEGTYFCCNCSVLLENEWEQEREKASTCVAEFMEQCLQYDEIWVETKNLKKILAELHPNDCPSPKVANLWIYGAVEAKVVVEVNRGDTEVVCLPRYAIEASSDIRWPEENTEEEETAILNLLYENNGAVDRSAVMNLLKENFPERMATRTMRCLVLRNGIQKQMLAIGRSASGQTIGLDMDSAQEELKKLKRTSTKATPEPEPEAEAELVEVAGVNEDW